MNQIQTVLTHLEQHGSITPLEAMERHGIMRLGARIYDLRRMGYKITRISVYSVNRYGNWVRYARYVLEA